MSAYLILNKYKYIMFNIKHNTFNLKTFKSRYIILDNMFIFTLNILLN